MRTPGWFWRWATKLGRRQNARVSSRIANRSRVLPPAQIKLLLDSINRIAAAPDEAGKIFYDRLFATAPEVRALFPADLAPQQKKFIQTIVWIVENLHKPNELAERVRDLGERHIGYGVDDEHYDAVGNALLWVVEDRLGADFTPDVRAAWAAAYDDVANRMKGLAAGPGTDNPVLP